MDLLKKLVDSLRETWNSQSKRKIIESSIFFIVFGVIIIAVGGSLFGKPEAASKQDIEGTTKEIQTIGKNTVNDEKNDLEREIEEILSQIDGAGKVNVMITYISGKEMVPAVDTKKTDNITQEKDSGGGTRNLSNNSYESKIVYKEGQGGGKEPIMLKEMQPSVKGVVVVADGAADPKVKESLAKAVEVLAEVPIHKVQIFERKK